MKFHLMGMKGQKFMNQLEALTTYDEVANTNLEGVFDLILQVVLEYELPQEALPVKSLIISDMEFDVCKVPKFEQVKRRFTSFGYILSKISLWNLASRNIQQPVIQNEEGTYLVSSVISEIYELVASCFKFLSIYVGGCWKSSLSTNHSLMIESRLAQTMKVNLLYLG